MQWVCCLPVAHAHPTRLPQLADEQAKLGEQTDEKDSLQLRCDSLAKKVGRLGCK